jgi:hypothetical protein
MGIVVALNRDQEELLENLNAILESMQAIQIMQQALMPWLVVAGLGVCAVAGLLSWQVFDRSRRSGDLF